jgi:hypothetical protein
MKKKGLAEVLGSERKLPAKITIENDQNKEIMDIGGVPEEHREVTPSNLPLFKIYLRLGKTCENI